MAYFELDCHQINDACELFDEAVLGAGILTLLSIRQPFHTVPAQFESVRAIGAGSPYLWGFKRAGYEYLVKNAGAIRALANARRARRITCEDFLVGLMDVPGLGIVKASFFAQLLVGEGACLDSHNCSRFGCGPRTFEFDKAKSVCALRKRIAKYLSFWQGHGTSSFFWDSWCDHVADIYPDHFTDGADVSATHLVALNLVP